MMWAFDEFEHAESKARVQQTMCLRFRNSALSVVGNKVSKITMRQELKVGIPRLINLGDIAKGAATEHGAEIGLLQNTAVNIDVDLRGLITAHDQYEREKVAAALRRAVQRDSFDAGREFLTLGKDLFKRKLGNQYSEAWDRTGLVGSLAIPNTLDEVQATLREYKAFLLDNPALENQPLELTARHAGELHDQLSAARLANNQKASLLIKVRDDQAKVLRRRLRGLIEELTQLIDPLDWRWPSFGFNKPGASEIADVPESLQVTLIGKTTAALKWDAASRAEYYRVWKRVIGVDEELVAVGSPFDLDFTVENLPSHVEVEFAISSVNNGGESATSEVRTVQTN
jgi:hypothetical protein